ncbi:MAG: GIY-YIG nuclease family protein [Cyanobium sp.]
MAAPPRARQGELFGAAVCGAVAAASPPPLLREQLIDWQQRLLGHQSPLFRREGPAAGQGDLFATPPAADGRATSPGLLSAPAVAAARALDPLCLEAQSLAFWRWPAAPHQGAAIYLVLDRPPEASTPLLLYVGETARADRRWKGDHDCKAYLAAYSEALRRVGLEPRLSIRFWCDVPALTAHRRAQEQALIRQWLPPFNKETRERWATPFMADPH